MPRLPCASSSAPYDLEREPACTGACPAVGTSGIRRAKYRDAASLPFLRFSYQRSSCRTANPVTSSRHVGSDYQPIADSRIERRSRSPRVTSPGTASPLLDPSRSASISSRHLSDRPGSDPLGGCSMPCPRCQHQNRPQAKFCEECATPLNGAHLHRPPGSHADPTEEVEGLRRALSEALEQQTATAEILRVIS